jgi:hypothetical protein
MPKLRVGNKQNASLNGEWGAHMRAAGKKQTAKLRRAAKKEDLFKTLGEILKP